MKREFWEEHKSQLRAIAALHQLKLSLLNAVAGATHLTYVHLWQTGPERWEH